MTRVNGNLNLSRAIGDLKYKCNQELPPAQQIITAEPDVCRVQLQPGDRFLLLACDGVWDVLTNQEVCPPPPGACRDREMDPQEYCYFVLGSSGNHSLLLA